MTNANDLIGCNTTLEDGSILKVVQIKDREDGPWVSYTVTAYNALPRKLVMPLAQFNALWSNHLLKKS